MDQNLPSHDPLTDSTVALFVEKCRLGLRVDHVPQPRSLFGFVCLASLQKKRHGNFFHNIGHKTVPTYQLQSDLLIDSKQLVAGIFVIPMMILYKHIGAVATKKAIANTGTNSTTILAKSTPTVGKTALHAIVYFAASVSIYAKSLAAKFTTKAVLHSTEDFVIKYKCGIADAIAAIIAALYRPRYNFYLEYEPMDVDRRALT